MRSPPSGIYREPAVAGRKGLVLSASRVALQAVATRVERRAPFELGGNPHNWDGRLIEADFNLPTPPLLGVINSHGFAEDVPITKGRLRVFRHHGDDQAGQPYLLDDVLVVDVLLSERGFHWLWGETMTRQGTLEIMLDFPTYVLEAGQPAARLQSTDFLQIASTSDPADSRVSLTLTVIDEWGNGQKLSPF